MIIAVYAPHDPRDKRMLWDYLAHVINQWQGEVVIMGDFNEVRVKSDRFGTNFNVLGANIFNSFINSTGLEEVHLGGSAFTWCHKSATKMSKLDRFFVSNNLLNIFPHISGITLDRFLSDHRPILLRDESSMIMVLEVEAEKRMEVLAALRIIDSYFIPWELRDDAFWKEQPHELSTKNFFLIFRIRVALKLPRGVLIVNEIS
ncbi:RNA-directed DNA polymerase, eukaryota [Tanacetum coccineum]